MLRQSSHGMHSTILWGRMFLLVLASLGVLGGGSVRVGSAERAIEPEHKSDKPKCVLPGVLL